MDEENGEELMTSIAQRNNKENNISKPNQNINIPKTPVSLLQVCYKLRKIWAMYDDCGPDV